MNHTQCLIIGSGPAGYTAAIYLVRSAIDCLLIEGLQVGGQLTQTTTIENFPGFPEGVDGFQLMDNMRQQAVNDTIIVATGATAKYLGLPDETKYAGQGVSACATCDGFFYRKKVVAVVGGGDTACEEADYLSHLANKVYLIVRKDYLRASEAMQQRVKENEKIEILFNTNTVGLFGDNGVEGAHLVRFKGTDKEELFDIAIDGFFLAIGHRPNTEFLGGQVDLDEQGYIKLTGHNTATNVEGVFAAGDVADPHYRQAIVAAAGGCRAAIDVKQYLS